MTTTYALHLKLDIILNDQPQRTYRDGRTIWDFEPEHRLIWIDQVSLDHICEIPPVTLPLGYQVRTICGRDVTTTRIRLVDTDEHPLPSCRSCFVENLRRCHDRAMAREPGLLRRRTTMLSLSVSIFVATLLLAPSLDDWAPVPDQDAHEIVQRLPLEDFDPSPNDAD